MRDVRMRGFRERTTVARALEVLEQRVSRLGDEVVSIVDAAGRVAAAEVVALASVPHFARSAMDGYALSGEATFGASAYAPVELAVVGESRPGRPYAGALGRGEAVRVATGAPVPDGADAVLMAEHAEEVAADEGAPGGRAVVRVREAVPPGKHVAAIGEDVRAGAVIVAAGRRLRPQDIGVLASTGVGEVRVVRRPSVRVLITGDELLPPGSAPSGACIVDSNSLVLAALARRDGALGVAVEYVRDRRERLRRLVGRAGGPRAARAGRGRRGRGARRRAAPVEPCGVRVRGGRKAGVLAPGKPGVVPVRLRVLRGAFDTRARRALARVAAPAEERCRREQDRLGARAGRLRAGAARGRSGVSDHDERRVHSFVDDARGRGGRGAGG
jgi:hypothetical protein